MLKTKVKASSITNLTDARYFAAWEVEWLGFNLEPGTETTVMPQFVNAVKDWVDGVKIVGEFGMQSGSEIQTAIEMMDLDAVQIGMFTGLNEIINLKGFPIIKEIVIDGNISENALSEILKSFSPFCESFVLNFDKNNISWETIADSKTLSINYLKTITQDFPIILSLDLNANNVDQVLETLNPKGIDLKGGEEEKVGVKSFDQLDEIFEAIEILV